MSNGVRLNHVPKNKFSKGGGMGLMGSFEAELSAVIGKFLKEIIGRGPKQVKVKICEDLLIIRIVVYTTSLDKRIKECENGQELLSNKKRLLFENVKQDAVDIIESYMNGINIKEVYYDTNSCSDEAVIVITATENIEKRLGLS